MDSWPLRRRVGLRLTRVQDGLTRSTVIATERSPHALDRARRAIRCPRPQGDPLPEDAARDYVDARFNETNFCSVRVPMMMIFM